MLRYHIDGRVQLEDPGTLKDEGRIQASRQERDEASRH
jgi:hypothetical protein